MNPVLTAEKCWNATSLDPRHLVVETDRVANLTPTQIEQVYTLFNEYGLVILQHEPVAEPVEELHEFGEFFGKPVTHDRADPKGLVVVAELKGLKEFVGASSGPHLFHTGGTFMPWDKVPKVVALQCVVQSRVGGRSMIAPGASAYRYLQENDPEALALLCDPEVFSVKRSAAGKGKYGETGGVRKPIFEKTLLGDGRIWLTFRFDGEVKLELRPDAAHEAFDKLLNFFNRSENQIDFHLQPNQIMICDNTSVVHARTAFQHGSGRKLNRLQLDGTDNNLIFGFPE